MPELRRIPAVVALVLAAGAALVGVGAATSAAPARLQVTEKEYTLTLSRLSVRKGQAIVQVLNFGMDNHDLVIQGKAKGSKPVRFALLDAGAHATKTLNSRRASTRCGARSPATRAGGWWRR